MRIPLACNHLNALKRHLKQEFPNISASRRLEFSAKGFGFKTYASILKALESGPIWVEPNDAVFLFEIGIPLDSATERKFSR